MHGWTGKILRIDLTKKKAGTQEFNADFAKTWMGGRGFAAKILWNELKPGIDPFSPENRLILATGPLTGASLPSSGKLLVAAKSPCCKRTIRNEAGTAEAYPQKPRSRNLTLLTLQQN